MPRKKVKRIDKASEMWEHKLLREKRRLIMGINRGNRWVPVSESPQPAYDFNAKPRRASATLATSIPPPPSAGPPTQPPAITDSIKILNETGTNLNNICNQLANVVERVGWAPPEFSESPTPASTIRADLDETSARFSRLVERLHMLVNGLEAQLFE